MAKQPAPARPTDWAVPARRVKWLVEKHFGGNRTAFAAKIGVSHTAIANIVAEKKPPGRKLLAAIAETLNVSAAWLLTGEGEPFVGSAGGPPKGVPISLNLLPGTPQECPALLSGRWLDDAGKFFTPTQYWFLIETGHAVLCDRRLWFRGSDKLLIETDPSKFPAKDELAEHLCVLNRRVGKETKVVLGLVQYTPDSEDGPERLRAYLYEARDEDQSEWIKEDVFRTLPGGKIVYEERTQRADYVQREPDPQIQYSDIVGVWMRLIRR